MIQKRSAKNEMEKGNKEGAGSRIAGRFDGVGFKSGFGRWALDSGHRLYLWCREKYRQAHPAAKMKYTVNGDIYDTEKSKRLFYLSAAHLDFTCYVSESGQYFIAGDKVPFPMGGQNIQLVHHDFALELGRSSFSDLKNKWIYSFGRSADFPKKAA